MGRSINYHNRAGERQRDRELRVEAVNECRVMGQIISNLETELGTYRVATTVAPRYNGQIGRQKSLLVR